MGSSVSLCTIGWLWITFEYKVSPLTTIPRDFLFPGNKLCKDFLYKIQQSVPKGTDCCLLGLFYNSFAFTPDRSC